MMKITPNAIGNYSPYNMKTNTVERKINTEQVSEQKKSEPISKEEKTFFTKMYPESKDEIIDYHFYRNTGKMSGVAVGSLFDKRG